MPSDYNQNLNNNLNSQSDKLKLSSDIKNLNTRIDNMEHDIKTNLFEIKTDLKTKLDLMSHNFIILNKLLENKLNIDPN